MIIVVKNNAGVVRTWAGKEFAIAEEYVLPTDGNRAKWANSSTLLTSIGNGDAEIGNGTSFFTDVNDAVNHLKGNVATQITAQPFSSKVLPDGNSVYRRTHGVSGSSVAASGNEKTIYVITYPACKMTGVEVVGCREGDQIDLKVLDTAAGTISTIANYPLNQFGFGVFLADGYHREYSNYDADLFTGLQIEITYYNNGGSAVTPNFNLILHEVK